MSSSPIEVIADKRRDEGELVEAIQNLGPVNEPPGFWTDIAEDESYGRLHRRHAVFQLFHRHVAPGMTLSQLALILRRPSWLTDEQITAVEDLGGHIPVGLTFDNTVLVLDVLPGPAPKPDRWLIYLSVRGQVAPEDFQRLLRGGAVDQAVSEAAILEVGFSPPVLDGLRPRQP